MRAWRLAVTVLVVVATAFLFYRWWQQASAHAERRGAGGGDPGEPGATTGEGSPGVPTPPVSGDGDDPPAPRLDRAAADRMREQLRALLAEAGPLGWAAEQPSASATVAASVYPTMPELAIDDAGHTNVDPTYIQKRVREDLFPLARKCYGDALERNPKLAGRLAVHFRIIGDKKVGGVVDETRILPETTMDDRQFQTCVTESLMSVTFDAPPGDREVTVDYPIEFSPEDDDSGID